MTESAFGPVTSQSQGTLSGPVPGGASLQADAFSHGAILRGLDSPFHCLEWPEAPAPKREGEVGLAELVPPDGEEKWDWWSASFRTNKWDSWNSSLQRGFGI